MKRMFTMDDVRRVCKETGADFNEAVNLLEQAVGNVGEAVRLHRRAHSIFVEPELVADGPRSLRDRLRDAWHTLPGARVRVSRGGRTLAVISPVVALLALAIAPPVTVGALLIMLLLGCRFRVERAVSGNCCAAM